MLEWLDGRQNTRARPQENFGRELMELFTMGVRQLHRGRRLCGRARLHRLELDTSAAAGQPPTFRLQRGNHDTAAKTFTFAVYPGGGKTIPARAAAEGMQDGLDLINALATSPITARYLAGKLYRFFVSEVGDISGSFVDEISSVFLRYGGNMKAVMRAVLHVARVLESRRLLCALRVAGRVRRALAEGGRLDRLLGERNNTLMPLGNMGQNLFEPPDVNGWDAGKGWFSTGSMLARMNFASALTMNQRFGLRERARPLRLRRPKTLVPGGSSRSGSRPSSQDVEAELANYLRATGPWTAVQRATPGEGPRPRPPDCRHTGVSIRMKVTRREFVKGGVAAFTVTFGAPAFITRAGTGAGGPRQEPRHPVSGRRQRRAQHARALQRSRRTTAAGRRSPCRPAPCCRSAPTRSNVALGLHPRLTGLRQIFNQGRLALIQRTGYPNQSRSHFQGTDIWSTANPANSAGLGWLGRYLDTLPSPLDPLIGWNTTRDLPRVLQSDHVPVPAIPSPQAYAFNSPNTGVEALAERTPPSGSARTCRSISPGSRSSTPARRRPWPRSTAWPRWRPTVPP